MGSVWSRLPLVFAAVVLPLFLVSCGTTTAAPKSVAKTSSPSRCQDAQLALSLSNTGNGGGSVVWVGTFVNQSRHPCELKGFPGFQMLVADNVPISTDLTDADHGTASKKIDLGHDEAASFVILVSDGAQSLPSFPACPVARTVEVTPPGAERGITIVAPPGFIAYPYNKGGACGSVGLGALIAGPAQRALCPACYPTPVPGESVT